MPAYPPETRLTAEAFGSFAECQRKEEKMKRKRMPGKCSEKNADIFLRYRVQKELEAAGAAGWHVSPVSSGNRSVRIERTETVSPYLAPRTAAPGCPVPPVREVFPAYTSAISRFGHSFPCGIRWGLRIGKRGGKLVFCEYAEAPEQELRQRSAADVFGFAEKIH